MKKNNIILIGFMGVGKGTVARAMVKEVQEVGINSHFQYVIDTDDLIESMENRAIKKILQLMVKLILEI